MQPDVTPTTTGGFYLPSRRRRSAIALLPPYATSCPSTARTSTTEALSGSRSFIHRPCLILCQKPSKKIVVTKPTTTCDVRSRIGSAEVLPEFSRRTMLATHRTRKAQKELRMTFASGPKGASTPYGDRISAINVKRAANAPANVTTSPMNTAKQRLRGSCLRSVRKLIAMTASRCRSQNA